MLLLTKLYYFCVETSEMVPARPLSKSVRFFQYPRGFRSVHSMLSTQSNVAAARIFRQYFMAFTLGRGGSPF